MAREGSRGIGNAQRRGATRLGCLVTLLFLAAVAYFGTGALRIYWRSLEFQDAMQRELRPLAKRENAEIARRYRFLADSLGLPELAGRVVIRRTTNTITIESWYEETLVLPGYHRPWPFDIRVSTTY